MKAVVRYEYGPPEVLRIEEVEKPVPKGGEVLIRIRASTVSQSDTHARAAHEVIYRLIGGLRRPRWRVLGVELSGEVEAVGAGVSQFHVGDAVFGTPPGFGAHAEYICLRERGALAIKPANISFEEAAAVCDGAGQALSTLRQAGTQKGQRLVIYGASGSLGTAAVQLANELGAHVTGVCSTAHVELVRSLGADQVVDYTQDDFRKFGPYDAIIDAVGKYSFRKGRVALRPGGIYVGTDLGQDGLATLVMAVTTKWIGDKRLKMAIGRRSRQDVEHLKALIEAGKFRPVVDRTYPMEQVVEAHRYVEAWHKTGNVVLTMGEDGMGGTAMSRDPAALRRFATDYTAAWCSMDPRRVAAHFAAGGSLAINGGAPAVGRGAITVTAQGFYIALPDMQVYMNDLIVEGDRIEYHWTFTGTNTGPGGTGKAVRVVGYEEWTIDDGGLIAASAGHYDAAEYARQLQHEVWPASSVQGTKLSS